MLIVYTEKGKKAREKIDEFTKDATKQLEQIEQMLTKLVILPMEIILLNYSRLYKYIDLNKGHFNHRCCFYLTDDICFHI